jgi:hypothetical protein
VEFFAIGKMKVGNFLGRLADEEDEVDGVCSGNSLHLLNLIYRVRLFAVFGTTLEDRFETRGVLKLLVSMRVLVRL